MKPKTAVLIIAVSLFIILPALFFTEPQNKQIFDQNFVFLGFQFTVLQSLMVIVFVSVFAPSIFFSLKYLKMIGRVREAEREGGKRASNQRDLDRASELLIHDDPAAALELLEGRDSPGATYLRALALEALGEPEEAEALLRRNFEDEEHVPSGYQLAKLLENNNGNPVDFLQAIARMDKQHAHTARARLLQFYDRNAMWLECLQLAKEIETLGGELTSELMAAYRFENIKLEAGGLPPKKQIEAYQSILRDVPKFVPANLALGDLHMASGSVEKAFQVYEHAFQETRNPVFLERFEHYYLEQGRPEDAIQIYRELLVRIGGPLLEFQLGKLYFKLEMTDESLEILEPLEPTLGHIPGYLYYLAELKMRRGHFQESLDFLKKLAATRGFTGEDFVCTSCQTAYQTWQRRCETCRSWDTITLEAGLVAVEAIPQNPIHYG